MECTNGIAKEYYESGNLKLMYNNINRIHGMD